MLYLDNDAVLRHLSRIDAVAVVTDALRRHRSGGTVLPGEAAMYWPTAAGDTARSLALPALVERDGGDAVGIKVINANPGNGDRGVPRANGILVMFDPLTARVTGILQAEHISSRRTAAVTAVAIRHFAPQARSLAVLGCGVLARAHLEVCLAELPHLDALRLYDREPGRAAALAEAARTTPQLSPVEVTVARSAREAVDGAQVVVPVTTVTEPYIGRGWLSGTDLVVNVSLDDCARDVFEECDVLVVDDWDLVATDDRRLLGRLASAGAIAPPVANGERGDGVGDGGGGRPVDLTLGDVVDAGAVHDPGGLVVVNPFGMGIHDVALGREIVATAVADGSGLRLPR